MTVKTENRLVDSGSKACNGFNVRPTIDYLKAAQDDFEADQKRVNREYGEGDKR